MRGELERVAAGCTGFGSQPAAGLGEAGARAAALRSPRRRRSSTIPVISPKWRGELGARGDRRRSPPRARRRCPRRRTGRPGGRPAAAPRAGARRARSWSRIQWKVAVEKTRSTGSSSSSSDEVGDQVGRRRSPSRSRALATIASEPSTASTLPVGQALEQLGGDPARAAAGVERGLVAAQLEPLEHLHPPAELGVGDARRRSRRPTRAGRCSSRRARRRSERRRHRAAVGAAGALEGVDRRRRSRA